MNNELTFGNVRYVIKHHVNGKGEETSSYHIYRVDGGEIENQTALCRQILIAYGENPNVINAIVGNLTLAGLVYKKINNIPLDL